MNTTHPDGRLLMGCMEQSPANSFFRLFTHRNHDFTFDCPRDSNGRIYVGFTNGQDTEVECVFNDRTLTMTNLTTQQTATTGTTYYGTFEADWSLWFPKSTEFVSEGTKVYYIQIYENDVLVRDFRPALDNNNVPCLYEKQLGTYHYNFNNNYTLTAGPVLSSIIATPSKSVIKATGETINIVVETQNQWSVSQTENWLVLSATGGTGTTTITAVAPNYTGSTDRTTTLTFTDLATTNTDVITIKQKKYSNGQPFYLGEDEITECFLGIDGVSEAYLGLDLVFQESVPTPTPTGQTRTIMVNNIPTPTFVEYNTGIASVSIDDGDNYIVLTLEYTDPSDSTSYQETIDDTGTTGITTTFSNGVLTAVGDWGDDITIACTISDPDCSVIPEGEDIEQISFVGNTIVASFPTTETDLECECTNQGGEWDSENEECIMSECAGFDSQEECDCVHGGGTWVVPEIGDPYCEEGGDVDCEGDPECLCTQGGGIWAYDEMTDSYYCDCGGDPECECISAGGEWDGSDCIYPEPEEPEM